MFKYYWLATVISFSLAGLLALLEVDTTPIAFVPLLFILPIHGIGSLLVMTGVVSSHDDLMMIHLFVTVVIFFAGVLIKRKYLNEDFSANIKDKG